MNPKSGINFLILNILFFTSVVNAQEFCWWSGDVGVSDGNYLTGECYFQDPNLWDIGSCAYIGLNSYGLVEVPGGTDMNTSMICVGCNSGSNGYLEMYGPDSYWFNTGKFIAGYNGVGYLNLHDGAQIMCYEADVSYMPGGLGYLNLDGPDTELNIAGGLSASLNDSRSYITVVNGAALLSEDASIGADSRVKINGIDSKWINNDTLTFCSESNTDAASIEITDGAYLETNFLHADGPYAITIIGDDSVCRIRNDVSSYHHFDGKKIISRFHYLSIFANGMLIMDGFFGDLPRNVNTTLNIVDGGRLAVYDPDLQAAASLGRYLDWIRLHPDELDISAYGIRHISEGELAGYTVLEALPSSSVIPGDINRDGDVDIFDFLTLKANYGRVSEDVYSDIDWSSGDLNGDGDIDIQDFLILKANYGQSDQ